MPEKIKVEIFKDATAATDIDTGFALEGLAKISQQINSDPFEIIGDSRKLRITNDPSSPARFDVIKWPAFDADFSIVLTDKVIQDTTAPYPIYGLASRYADRNLINGVALVKANAIQPEIVTAHEVGHLMGMKYPKNSNNDSHCETAECLMYEHVRIETAAERVAQKGIHAFLERRGYRPAEYVHVQKHAAQEFCSPCREQLAQKAFFSLKYLNGEQVQRSWL